MYIAEPVQPIEKIRNFFKFKLRKNKQTWKHLATTNLEILTMQLLYRSYNPSQHWFYNYLGRCNILFDCFRMYRLQSICICSRGQYRSLRTKMEFYLVLLLVTIY